MNTKIVIAVIFSHGPMAGAEPVHMELGPDEYMRLVTAKSNQRFIQLEGAHHNLDHIVTFWDVNQENEIG